MNIKELLHNTAHRPWNIPSEPWKFYQEWNQAIFLHWQVELDDLKKFLPKGLEIDLYDGKAWVSVVAFTMENIRPKNFLSFLPISNFDEINIRTYVKKNNKSGVYFLSIEGGKRLSCEIAKGISKLPYRFSNMKRTNNTYTSYNSQFKDQFEVTYDIGEVNNNKDSLDKWLTERYALFQDTKKILNKFEIHHLEWSLRNIELKKININYKKFNKLIISKPNKIHYSSGVKVVAWDKQTIDNYENSIP
ncbi:conserved hypothetical protein (DUF2071) [Formosa sp. Hel1_33_131]|uniref:YqjF family protein n=1 Tax=Formosa sp. Hel1_33_131 TaxID=1336794 RepID=UPI00084E0BAB|nr:DUF2071 domain-containing protein [Formosa sp. Hel1_33_131]AOR27153.1 conserved hypothetical protein (DUF2071) [Formosa sp. Hel1_33_131]